MLDPVKILLKSEELTFQTKFDTPTVPLNPISALINFCDKSSLPLPLYEFQDTTKAKSCTSSFNVVVKVGEFISCGSGPSKTKAKGLRGQLRNFWGFKKLYF